VKKRKIRQRAGRVSSFQFYFDESALQTTTHPSRIMMEETNDLPLDRSRFCT
jgi:hypothetical protein